MSNHSNVLPATCHSLAGQSPMSRTLCGGQVTNALFSDLLQRHYTVHGRDANNQEGLPPNPMIPKSAGRTPIACSNCAKTKTKCDKKFPCSRCASRNLKCTLRPTRRASKNANRIMNPEANGTVTPTENSTSVTPAGSKRSSPQPQPRPQSSDDSKAQAPHHASHHSSPEQRKGSVQGTPAFFESPTGAPPPLLPAILSPLPTPDTLNTHGFTHTTPMSGFEDFAVTRDGSESGSPRYMMEWSHMNFAQGPQFEPMGRPDMMMSSSMSANMGLFTDPRASTLR